MGNAYKIFVDNLEGERPLPSCRMDDNIKNDLREVEWKVVVWILLVEDRSRWRALVRAVMNLWIA